MRKTYVLRLVRRICFAFGSWQVSRATPVTSNAPREITGEEAARIYGWPDLANNESFRRAVQADMKANPAVYQTWAWLDSGTTPSPSSLLPGGGKTLT